MSYDSKIATARQSIETHNSNVEEKNKVNFDNFLVKLQELGGTSDDALKAVSWEDLKECGVPVILARRLAFIFREQGSGDSGKSGWVSESKAGQMSIRDLVERFDPNEVDTNVAKRMKALSKGKRCLVFDEEGKLNVDKTVEILQDIKEGLPEIERTEVDGNPVMIYYIGDQPNRYFEENPLFPGRALRRGLCDLTQRSWSVISLEIRQFLKIAISQKDLVINHISDANDILDIIADHFASGDNKKVLDFLKKRYPKSWIKFVEMKKDNLLPTMMIKAKDFGYKDGKQNNPFGQNQTF